jgi:uncharacterized coiled-coil protein SlyX
MGTARYKERLVSDSAFLALPLAFSWAQLPPWLPLAISGVAALLAILCLIYTARAAVSVRTESRAASDTVERLGQHVDSFEQRVAAKIQQAIAPLGERIAQGEQEMDGLKAEMGSLQNSIAEVHKGLERAVQRFEHFEEYFRAVFEKELRFAFRAFDETMGGVMKEMKGELLRGIARIDQIQNVVSSRSRAEAQLISSEEEARRLLKPSAEPAPAPKVEPAEDRPAGQADPAPPEQPPSPPTDAPSESK